MTHWLRVRWRWFRMEFNRRAHDRVYWDEPTAYAVSDGMGGPSTIYAHPSIAAGLRAEQRRIFSDAALLYVCPQIYENANCVERRWKWVRR